MNLPCAHLFGIPVEETLGSYGPALLLAGGAAAVALRARFRRVRIRAGARTTRPSRRAAVPRHPGQKPGQADRRHPPTARP